MVMQCDRRLNQPLKKFLFRTVGFAPHVFPNLVRIIEVLFVEQLNPAMISVRVHVQILSDPRQQTEDAISSRPNDPAVRRHEMHHRTSEARFKPRWT